MLMLTGFGVEKISGCQFTATRKVPIEYFVMWCLSNDNFPQPVLYSTILQSLEIKSKV